jgi:hypothetical protein
MKALLLSICLALCACVETYTPGIVQYGTVEYCDPELGCRSITGDYYYDTNGVLYYYDSTFTAWIGPGSYYVGGRFYPGHPVGYNGYYHNYGSYHNRDLNNRGGGGGHRR